MSNSLRGLKLWLGSNTTGTIKGRRPVDTDIEDVCMWCNRKFYYRGSLDRHERKCSLRPKKGSIL